MEELIFFAVIIGFSILESIARKRRARAGAVAEPPAPEEWEGEDDRVGTRGEVSTYDAPSYDSLERAEPRPRPGAVTLSTVPDGPSGAEVAADIWAEIAGLAGAKVPGDARTRAIERQSPPLPVKPEPALPTHRERTPTPVARAPVHRVHLSHAGYGTDPSERAPSEQDGLDPLAETLGKDPAAIRAQLRSHGAHQLRQAIILQEVMGPPAAIREDRFDGWDLGLGSHGE